jgi:tetratricopeptide (TPR) repeat protein
LSLLEPPLRTEFLNTQGRLDIIVDRAWADDRAEYVPKLLELVFPIAKRTFVNRWWRKLGLPQEWQLNEQSSLPSVKIAQLEADGKIDEAMELARRSGASNAIERILIRASEWDKWLQLDAKRVPIVSADNLHQQRALVLLMLGRLDDANALLDAVPKSKGNPGLVQGAALLARALGRNEEFETFVSSQPGPKAFELLMSGGLVKEAFSAVGVESLDLESVKQWIKSKAYEKKGVVELNLLDIAEVLFQVGYHEQGDLIEKVVLDHVTAREVHEGHEVWVPIFRHWRESIGRERERVKALHQWKEALVRETKPGKGTAQKKRDLSGLDESGIYLQLFPRFSTLAPSVYSFLFDREVGLKLKERTTVLDDAERDQVITAVLQQMDDLHEGRMPDGFKGTSTLKDLHHHILINELESAERLETIYEELASMFDALNDTQFAIDILFSSPRHLRNNKKLATYLTKVGSLDEACTLLISEFEAHSTDLDLLIQLTDNLEKLGRFAEADRYRIQAFSSVASKRNDLSEEPLFTMPYRQEISLVMEQLWLREENRAALQILIIQLGKAAKEELRHAGEAAKYVRMQAVQVSKVTWPNTDIEFKRINAFFANSLESLILAAIAEKNEKLTDDLIRVAHRCSPLDIDLPISVVPVAERVFGKEVSDKWFELFYVPMRKHLIEFPEDTLIGNNAAWLAASCNRHLEEAQKMSSKVVENMPTATYLDTLAEVEYRLGNVTKAIELSERCRQIEPLDKHHQEQLNRFLARKP